jgi:ribosomal protein L11 methyltransferase
MVLPATQILDSPTHMLPHRWLSITVTLPPDGPGAGGSELLPSTLVELGGRGVEEEGGAFTTFLPPPEDLEGFLRLVRSRIDELALPGAELRWGWRAHDDWEILWKKGLGPRSVTDRLIIAPSWEIPDVEEGQILIVLDPGMAFGTAEHATTRGCLRLMDSRVREGDRIADVGSGSGILSIAAARLGAREVLAVDGDPLACDAARENLMANEVQGKVRVVQEEYRGREPLPGERYQGIVANIQPSVLLPLLPAFRDSLEEGGWLILSGILAEERGSVLSVAAGYGLNLEEEDPEGEWWTGAFSLASARA